MMAGKCQEAPLLLSTLYSSLIANLLLWTKSRSETPQQILPRSPTMPRENCMSCAKELALPLACKPDCKQLQSGGLCILVEKRNGSRHRTSPGNLYPAVMWTWNFCWRNPLDGQLGIESAQIGAKLARVPVVDAVKPQGSSRLYIFEDVVNEHGLRGLRVNGLEGGLKDHGRRLAGLHRTGIDAGCGRKESKKAECGFKVSYVDRFGIGKQRQALAAGQRDEQIVGLNWLGIERAVPGIAKPSEVERTAEALGDVAVPVVRRHPAFLPVRPARVGLDDGPELVRAERNAARQIGNGARNVDSH